MRLSADTGSIDGSTYAEPSGTTPGSRRASRMRATASEIDTRAGVAQVRGGRGSATTSVRLRTK
jgi:hypothetical protein